MPAPELVPEPEAGADDPPAVAIAKATGFNQVINPWVGVYPTGPVGLSGGFRSRSAWLYPIRGPAAGRVCRFGGW